MRGLLPLKTDRRDYSHRTFGAIPVSQLPAEYLLPSNVLNQGPTSECTAYTASAIQESQHGIPFDPDWFFQQEGVVNGLVNESGYDLRIQMKTGCKIGFKPLVLNQDPAIYKEDSYFACDGYNDLFDNIRIAMWLGKDEKRCASLGTEWYAEFEQPDGIIPDKFSRPDGLHNVKCAGWTTKNGILYLVIQNSYGTIAGDKGFYYFSRPIVNKVFTAGAFVWRQKPDPDQIKTISLLVSLISKLVSLYNKIIGKGRSAN